MSEIKLKKCPFCGGKARMNSTSAFVRKAFYVNCDEIGCEMQCSTKLCFTKAEAAEIWNKRAKESD